jgi:hypothetical protein
MGLTASGLVFFALRHLSADIAVGAGIGAAMTAFAATVVVLKRARASAHAAPIVRERDRDYVLVADPLAPPVSPFRVRLVRVSTRAVPRLSATATTAVGAVSLIATGLLVPVALHLPRWIEAEIVLGTWWVTGAVALSVLLFRGARIADDYYYRAPWHRPAEKHLSAASSSTRSGSSSGWLDPPVWLALEGGAGALVGILLAGAAFAAAWLVVELAAPIVFLLFYALLSRAVERATGDNRECKGNLARSLAWGTLWASTYAAPVVAFVWLLHAVIRADAVDAIGGPGTVIATVSALLGAVAPLTVYLDGRAKLRLQREQEEAKLRLQREQEEAKLRLRAQAQDHKQLPRFLSTPSGDGRQLNVDFAYVATWLLRT